MANSCEVALHGQQARPDTSRTGRPIPGLYAAGEMVGGLFIGAYASGSSMMSGATFGRMAGAAAADAALAM